MVKLKIEVEDFDLGESIEVTLPCDIKNKVDLSHELLIVNYNNDLSLGYYDEVDRLNELLDDINAESPAMTIDILSSILIASGCYELSDKTFIEKITNSDFMFEEISIEDDLDMSDKERCAKFLATEMMIPFAKNITEDKLEEITKLKNNVYWIDVWDFYDTMGFQIIRLGEKIYAFHWGDAEV